MTWLNHVWHDSFICDTAHSCVTWLIHMQHDSFIGGMTQWNILWLITGCRKPTGCLQVIFRERATNYKALLRKRATNYRALLWKLQVIFRERATNYRALLRKMTCKDKAFYGSSPPCSHLQLETSIALLSIHMWHDSFIYKDDSFICDMTHLYATQLIHMCHDSFAPWDVGNAEPPSHDMPSACAIRLIHIRCDWFTCDVTPSCEMTHAYVPWLIHSLKRWKYCASFSWLIHLRHDAFICDVTELYVTWLIYAKWQIHVCHDSFAPWNVENVTTTQYKDWYLRVT